jgi:hypothetical protein
MGYFRSPPTFLERWRRLTSPDADEIDADGQHVGAVGIHGDNLGV